MKKPNPPMLATTLAISILLISIAFSITGTQAANPNENDWQLEITGLVNQPLNLTLKQLTAMPATSVNAGIYCVDFPYKVVESGNWTGIKLSYLFETAGVSPSAIKVAFYASDGYTTDLTLETANETNVIVAYEKDGALLGNLRLVTPGKWGYKWIHQLTKIELVNYDFKGKWESLGYSDDGTGLGIGGSNNLPGPTTPDTKPNPQNTTGTSSTNPQATNSSETLPTQDIQDPTTEAPDTPNQESLPTESIAVASFALAAIISSCALLYLRKRKKEINE